MASCRDGWHPAGVRAIVPLPIAVVVLLAGCPRPSTGDAAPVDAAAKTPPETAPPDGTCTSMPPGPRSVRLLTRSEYDRTVRDLLGDTTAPALRSLPVENVLIGFENDGDNHRATPLLVEGYLQLAEDIAGRAMAERRHLVMPCDPGVVGPDACAETVVAVLGKRAFRRPLTDTEHARLRGLYAAMRDPFGFDKAVELVVQAMLVSPQFLYRVDVGTPPATLDDVVLASPWEMASRLSYFLWGTMPDDALFAAAESGALLDVREVEAQARRMLADPRAQEATASFFRQWLGLDKLTHITKDAATFPELAGGAQGSWRAGVDAFVQSVVWERSGTLEELLTSNVLYVDGITAPLYGLEGPDHGGLEAREAPAGTRAGLLTQPGLLALLANPTQSSPIRRGVFIREKLMCQPISPPPPGVVIEPPPADPTLTTRERFAAHTNDPQCAGCHVMIDPIGFGFESYDALGRFRSTENGLAIDDSGELAYTTDPEIEGPFRGAVELAHKLAQSQQVKDCVLGQALTFAIGRVPDADADRCTLDILRRRFNESDSLRELFVAIAVSDAFRTTVAP